MDDEPVAPKNTDSPLTKVLVVIGVVILIGGVAAMAVWFGYKVVTKVAPGVKSSWQDVEAMRAADAKQVEAETKAGDAYKSHISLQLTVEPEKNPDGTYKAVITGKIVNSGDKTIMRITALASFYQAGEREPADKREIILKDATSLSASPDAPIPGGVTADTNVTLSDVSSKWDAKRFEYSIGTVRVDLDAQQ